MSQCRQALLYPRNNDLLFHQLRLFATQPPPRPNMYQSQYHQPNQQTQQDAQEYIYGINPVLASLSAQRRKFQKLYLNITEKGDRRKSHPKIDQIYKMAHSFGVKTKYLSKNVVMKVSKLDYIKIRKLSDIETLKDPKQGQFFLFLDQITDPQNFGSILRTAMFIGVDGIIVNQNNSCGLTPTVSKVSSGALEFIPLYSVKFLKPFIEDAQKGVQKFKIISTDIDSTGITDEQPEREIEVEVLSSDEEDSDKPIKGKKGKQLEKHSNEPVDRQEERHEKYAEKDEDDKNIDYQSDRVISIDELKLKKNENIILVLGSEGDGVSKTLSKLADHRVMIPPQLSVDQIGKYPFNLVDSLNVGVSAGLLIYHIRHLMKHQ
ncbi:ribose methyltransferase [Stylonychia lemnae]|uniref:Ribose methyltransferase n=1 Tax=Stylonychia lemnae TaxID=5949 RepID=A0A078B8H6_STYLE|nr:ribose methyltransferase [Stylonychia lemnae]|eukprot:CDW89858.1 ribose methyltransferase [Stylonychia lemnae]